MTDLEAKDTEASPSSFEVLGRVVHVRPLSALNDGQRIGFAKVLRRYAGGALDGQGVLKLDQALSKLLSAEDNDWLDYQIMEGALEWPVVLRELLACLRPSDTVPVKPVPVKRAARAKKAVPKKAAKRA
jgi:hypothetical protein